MRRIANELREVLRNGAPDLRSISERRSLWRYGEGKWSKREILGHLIDSAANNHQRFVRVADGGALKHTTYDADAWVARQRYHERDWSALVDLWLAYNRHLADLIEALPDSLGDVMCDLHFDRPVTFRFVVEDYVDHMNHHLRQIFEEPLTDYGTVSFVHPDDREA